MSLSIFLVENCPLPLGICLVENMPLASASANCQNDAALQHCVRILRHLKPVVYPWLSWLKCCRAPPFWFELPRAHIAGRLNSGFDREIGALPPRIYYINWGGLVRASGFRSGFRCPAMWALMWKARGYKPFWEKHVILTNSTKTRPI
jgi:hypothetical protein